MADRVLCERIEVLRRELEYTIEQGKSLQDPAVMGISMRLDRLIAQYLRQELSKGSGGGEDPDAAQQRGSS